MREDKKRERLAALLGLTPPPEPKAPTLDDQLASREADATLIYFETPEAFREIECKRCAHKFAVNMASVAYCSDKCRQLTLADIGIEWDSTKSPTERWGRHVPLVVPTQALELLTEIKQEGLNETEVAQLG